MNIFRSRKRFIGILCIVSMLYIGVCAYLWVSQKQFIFEPTRNITKTPEIYDLTYEDIYIPISNSGSNGNGRTDHVHGWWIPSKNGNGKALLYLHGSAFNIGANVRHAHRLNQMGFSVLLIDYRGYGLSDGIYPSENTVYADAEAAWDYLIQDQSFRPKDIVIYGHSLGGAVGIHLALGHPDAGGLIVESAFTSIVDVAKNRNIYRIFPLRWIVNQKFDSIAKISRLRTPVLFIHGVKDKAIPTYMSQQLYDNTTAPKRLLLVPDGAHNNNAGIDELRYIQAVADFLEYAMDTPSIDARCCRRELGKA